MAATVQCMHVKAVKKEPTDGNDRTSNASTVSTGTDGSDPGPVQSFVMKHFGSKQAYNKFKYRLNTCGDDEAKAKYESLQDTLKKDGDADEETRELEELIVAVTNKLPIDHIVRKRKIVDEKAGIGTEGWVSWTTAVKTEGYDVLLEQVETHQIDSRKHPGLLSSSKIKYPENLQVYMSSDVKVTTNAVRDEKVLSEVGSAEPDDHEAFLKEFASAKIGISSNVAGTTGGPSVGGISSASSDGSHQQGAPAQSDEEKSKIAIKALRIAHSAWDKNKREFTSLVQESVENENTSGSKCERTLAILIDECTQIDKLLVELEVDFLRGKWWKDVQLQDIATKCTDIKAKSLECREKGNALRQWFKMK